MTARRSVRAPPAEVERALTPERFVENEGSFHVTATREEGETTVLTVAGGGLEFDVRAERTPDGGLRYEQAGEAGPFAAMETEVSFTPVDDRTRVTAVSRVSLGLPLAAVTDRLAAWKRRGELRRALDAFARELD